MICEAEMRRVLDSSDLVWKKVKVKKQPKDVLTLESQFLSHLAPDTRSVNSA